MTKKTTNKRWNKTTVRPKGYMIRLSFNMLAAMVDIHEDYEGQDSPRWNPRTMAALRHKSRKYAIGEGAGARLTSIGLQVLPAALELMKPWRKTKRRVGRRAA